MDVELYVYDLSGGLARQYSVAIAGIHIDAIYHTAVVLGGVEYFFGQGIHRKVPGSTHHGRPMQVIRMGRTDLPLDLVEEYIQSLDSIYTPESYDLFVHNCNNFSQDLCMFLVGKSIPEQISSLPETFLKTPIGQMMRGQIDQSMRRMTQAPDAASGRNAISSARSATSQSHESGASQRQTNSTTPTVLNAAPRARKTLPSTKHQHIALRLSTMQKRVAEPILAKACPPLDKLLMKISSDLSKEDKGAKPNGHQPENEPEKSTLKPIQDLADYVKLREAKGLAEAPLPDMHAITSWITSNFMQISDQFAIVDLLRISAVDPRVSAYLATDLTLMTMLWKVFGSSQEVPYSLRFTSLQLALNMFSSCVAQEALLNPGGQLRVLLGDLLASSLLINNSKIRVQAASLATNLVAIDHNQRIDGLEDIVDVNSIADGAIESALVQAVVDETESRDTLSRLLYALGILLYRAPTDSVRELCEAMDVLETLRGKDLLKGEPLPILVEVEKLLS